MKISGRKGGEVKNVSFGKTKGIQGTSSSSPGRAEGVGSADSTVAISDRARMVSDARRALDALPDIRADRVNDIQDTLGKGNYRVEGKRVADKMVDDAVQEIRKRTRGG